MIIDSIKNASLYHGLGPRIRTALSYLQESDLAFVDVGRHDIDGDDCFALIQDYDTKPREGVLWEAHREYTDVQFVVSGQELMGYANLETMPAMKVTADYDEAKDIIRFEGEGDFVVARAGTFVILTPHDAHMPGIAVAGPEPVRKVVVKVRAS